jgi:hypothetical protein
MSHSYTTGGAPLHAFSVYIHVASAAEAMRRLRSAPDGVGVYVFDEDES